MITERKQSVNETFKILYAFGITFVVMGHCNGGGVDLLGGWMPLYGFHMTLFFFGSGYFYHRKPQSCLHQILEKARRLLLPAYGWNLFYGIFAACLHCVGFTAGGDLTLRNLLLEPIRGDMPFGWNMAVWFVFPLFFVQVIHLVIDHLLSADGLADRFLLPGCLVSFGMAAGAVWLSGQGWNRGWTLQPLRVVYLMAFYLLGRVYREKLEPRGTCSNAAFFTFHLCVMLAIIAVTGGPVGALFSTYSMSFTNGIFLPLLIPILGIAFWLRVSQILTPVLGKSRCIRAVADHTYEIMTHHITGSLLLSSVYALIFLLTGELETFDMPRFLSTPGYAFFPRVAHTGILYVIVGLLVPLAYVYLRDWARAFLSRWKDFHSTCS